MKHKAIIVFDFGAASTSANARRIESVVAELSGFQSLEWIEISKCPYSSIRAAYNKAFKDYAVAQITEKGLKAGSQRAKKIKSRWEDYNTLKWWVDYFDFCKESDFLMGKIPPRGEFRQFRLTIDYLINEVNLIKIMEGHFHGK
ncbi:MAG: hypothetical protein ACTSV7_00605 [Candidatus Baldrarchaeia archaeon]